MTTEATDSKAQNDLRDSVKQRDSEGRFHHALYNGFRPALVFVVASAVFGAGLALVWHWLVDLPHFVVISGGTAQIDEQSMSHYFDTDFVYSILGIAAGLIIGIIGWFLFKDYGWPLVLLVLFAVLGAAATCWFLGVAIGPTGFEERLSAAVAGENVPIDFALRSPSAVLIWVLSALTPVLVGSIFTRDKTSR